MIRGVRHLSLVASFCALVVTLAAPLPLAALSGEGTLELSLDTLFASEAPPPLWLTSNADGVYNDDTGQVLPGISGSYSLFLNDNIALNSAVSATYRASENPEALLPTAWLGVSAYGVTLRGGSVPLTLGKLPREDLSTGSLAVSRNALPIPRVTLGTEGFQPVPLLGSFLETDFGISHGWFTDDRYVPDTLLHEKWLYLRLKREDTFAIHAGLVHEVMWGGDNDNAGEVTFDNYGRVFFGRSGGEDASVSDQINALGNTLGIWDFGMALHFPDAVLHGYYQHHFEGMGSFWRFRNAHDGLWGTVLELEEQPIPYLPDTLLYERVITKFQSGKYHDLAGVQLGGRDSYYSNGLYRSGWTHHGRIVGTPLFIAVGEDEAVRIASNRVDVHHFGIGGAVGPRTRYRVLLSRVSHRQAYAPVSLVAPDEKKLQWSTLVELKSEELFGVSPLSGGIGLGLDTGDLYDTSVGVLLSAAWKLY